MGEFKQEIERILKQYLSQLNLERININETEYKIFLNKIVQLVLLSNYNGLNQHFLDNFIESKENIEKCIKTIFDLFITVQSFDIKYITSKEQKKIFWIYDNKLYKYDTQYSIKAILRYRENIILFLDTKKSDNAPLTLVLNFTGKELFSIPFPMNQDSECVNQNISFYGGKIIKEKSILEVVFVNGNCWLEFWCHYDLKEKKYIRSGLRK